MRGKCISFFAIFLTFVLVSPCLFAKSSKLKSSAFTSDLTQIISLLKVDDIFGAADILRFSKNISRKDAYLLHEFSVIEALSSKSHAKRFGYDKYKKLGIAFHNLFLFLKSNGVEQSDFLDAAMHAYRRASHHSKSKYREWDCNILQAALLAASDDVKNQKKSKKVFRKVKSHIVAIADANSVEHLAAYYAAAGDLKDAMRYLKSAFEMSPSRTLSWIEIGDDFFRIAGESDFKQLVASMKSDYSSMSLKAPLDSDVEYKLDMPPRAFFPPKTLPELKRRHGRHYRGWRK